MPVSAFRRATAVVAVAGLSLTGASAASAATDGDCTGVNTVDGASPTAAADIQSLFAASAPLVCITGTVTLTSRLVVTDELTLHGLAGATFDGGNADSILQQLTADLLTVEGIRFTKGNNALGLGGAIDGENLVVRNSVFDDNVAEIGGAVSGSMVVVENSIFTDNLATLSVGAVVGFDSLIVRGSTFSHNNAAYVGGAVAGYGVTTISNSTFDSNLAGFFGGAIYSEADDYTIENSTFVANVSLGDAGAVFGYGGAITQSTFLDNSADNTSDGQAVRNGGSDPLVIHGSIFAGASSDPQIFSTTAVDDLGGNLFSTTQLAETWAVTPHASTQFSRSAAAVFGSNVLASNGGATQTVAISPTGPAVDAVPGTPSLLTDQRGVARTALSDAGAFEIAAPTALAATGVEAGWLAALASGLLALGLGLRRRRSVGRLAQ